ncbi:MAG: hypothetical protein PUC87_06570, partial [Galactobacillus timonensis]|nr:hypothetical protein [Galactobacillus timonensis]
FQPSFSIHRITSGYWLTPYRSHDSNITLFQRSTNQGIKKSAFFTGACHEQFMPLKYADIVTTTHMIYYAFS